MIFEIGKYYRHTSGSMLHMIALAETWMYGLSKAHNPDGRDKCGHKFS